MNRTKFLIALIMVLGIVQCSFNANPRLKGIFSLPFLNSELDLSNLTLSSGTLTPVFSSNTTSYSATVAISVSSITVTPTISVSTSTITVNGTSVTSGTASNSISLSLGLNTITVVVTAKDLSTKNYSIIITRGISALSAIAVSSGTLSPLYSADTTSYNLSVLNSISQITITPTAVNSATTIAVNGTIVVSGVASGNISLTAGAFTTITLITTAQDGSTSTYTINAFRLAAGAILRFFVTNVTYTGNLGTPTGADTKCNSDANKPNDGSTYKAMLVTNSATGTVRHACNTADCGTPNYIDWVLNLNTTYVRASDPSATIFTTGGVVRIFAFGALTNSFESGAQKEYWSGLNSDWTYSNGNSCFSGNTWSASSGNGGRTGLSDSTSNTAISNIQYTCSATKYLLCVEQ